MDLLLISINCICTIIIIIRTKIINVKLSQHCANQNYYYSNTFIYILYYIVHYLCSIIKIKWKVIYSNNNNKFKKKALK